MEEEKYDFFFWTPRLVEDNGVSKWCVSVCRWKSVFLECRAVHLTGAAIRNADEQGRLKTGQIWSEGAEGRAILAGVSRGIWIIHCTRLHLHFAFHLVGEMHPLLSSSSSDPCETWSPPARVVFMTEPGNPGAWPRPRFFRFGGGEKRVSVHLGYFQRDEYSVFGGDLLTLISLSFEN